MIDVQFPPCLGGAFHGGVWELISRSNGSSSGPRSIDPRAYFEDILRRVSAGPSKFVEDLAPTRRDDPFADDPIALKAEAVAERRASDLTAANSIRRTPGNHLRRGLATCGSSAVAFPADCSCYGIGIPVDGHQQNARRSVRNAASPLPLPKCPYNETEAFGEFTPDQPKPLS